MSTNQRLCETPFNETDSVRIFRQKLQTTPPRWKGVCGFDGFIDTFIRLEAPASMAEFGPKVAAAAGIAASYPAQHLGDKFGGNGPLLLSGLHGLMNGEIDLTYIGALGDPEPLPIFAEALQDKTAHLYTIAEPAHSDCLEFTDGKVMLSDLRACAEVTWERILEKVGEETLSQRLAEADFIGAVNWGKLIHVGTVWEGFAKKLAALGKPAKEVPFFMDLAEFEQRPMEDRKELIGLVERVTGQCTTMLSMNLKEAWQMADSFDGDFHGAKKPEAVTALAAFLKEHIKVDKIIIHPNNGAVCADNQEAVWVSGPFCKEPLVSTGAGDHFGAGCLIGSLLGLDNFGIALLGVCTSGYFVRTGEAPDFPKVLALLDQWAAGDLPERL
ncbi:MAG: hypothetical protein JJT75_10915 [Opitutales bacterium]|nr:hypothetical protein [Opitutales bacterium]MCH8541846.1 hypothetical protein [Opitutales bacterium]